MAVPAHAAARQPERTGAAACPRGLRAPWLWACAHPAPPRVTDPSSVCESCSLHGFSHPRDVPLFSCSGLYLTQVIIFGGLEACYFTKEGI